MPVNPNIALGLDPQKPLDIMGAYGNALTIRTLSGKVRCRTCRCRTTRPIKILTARRSAWISRPCGDTRVCGPGGPEAAGVERGTSAIHRNGAGLSERDPGDVPGEQALQGWIAAAQSPEKRMELIEGSPQA